MSGPTNNPLESARATLDECQSAATHFGSQLADVRVRAVAALSRRDVAVLVELRALEAALSEIVADAQRETEAAHRAFEQARLSAEAVRDTRLNSLASLNNRIEALKRDIATQEQTVLRMDGRGGSRERLQTLKTELQKAERERGEVYRARQSAGDLPTGAVRTAEDV